MSKKHISIIGGCYNEVDNVEEFARRVTLTMEKFPQYDFSIWFIDNASVDGTIEVLRKMAEANSRVKVILNARNFGHIRSPFHGLLQVTGDAAICLATDLQEPPELIEQYIPAWEKGFSIVMGVKTTSMESPVMYWLRTQYYRTLKRLAEMEMYENATGTGLYERKVIELLRNFQDPYPYFRGMLAEIGLPAALIPYQQKNRTRGITKNNWYSLMDMAMLGMTNHTKVPLRLATIMGFFASFVSLGIALLYLVLKLVYWQNFPIGLAPMLIGLFFLCSVQLFFTGIMGEYLGAIYTKGLKRPLVVERERLNC